MTLIRWQPYREVNTLHQQLDRLLDNVLAPMSVAQQDWLPTMPAAELSETEEALLLKLEVPGMEPKDLNVEVTEQSVSISGERKSETSHEENGSTRSEFRYGKFQRVIPLPTRVQNTKVEANYKDGILVLTLPKTEEVKNKVVKVNLG
ncbi:MAG: Hsp20/alpha crystallin family protein [Synechococcales cyanobacterium K44_A2020_017]|nr:Hsp20/alpha crystallin family protein [Synechococcales cyanobacterium K32_A2020_035]MBF2093401.1 Hsp20/alpha crystallin family protein [Synechococcales cyanobacterium K44_A2020_017]